MGEKEKDIGALWLKTSKAGNKFMSGKIDVNGVSVNIVVFKNSFKDTEAKPDYKIYASKPKDGADALPQAPGRMESFEDDPIPF